MFPKDADVGNKCKRIKLQEFVLANGAGARVSVDQPQDNWRDLNEVNDVRFPLCNREAIAAGYEFSPQGVTSTNENQTINTENDLLEQLMFPNGQEPHQLSSVVTQTRKDIATGLYRSRLNYTLYEKYIYLQQKILAYESATSPEERRHCFQSKRLVTKGPNSRKATEVKYVAGYNYKVAVGLVAVASLILRTGCCTFPQAIDAYMNTVSVTRRTLGIPGKESKVGSIITRLRTLITEQLPVLRISGKALNLFYIDGKQHRQTYLLFANISNEYAPDSKILPLLANIIQKKLFFSEKLRIAGQPRTFKNISEYKISADNLQQNDLELLEAVYGSVAMGLLKFSEMEPQYSNFYMENREECMLV